PCKKPKNTDENFSNAIDLYDPVYNKLLEVYNVKDYDELINNENIHPYIRKGLDQAFGFSINDFDEGKRVIPPLTPKLREFQNLILNTPNKEITELLKKDYSKAGLFNMGKYLPENVSMVKALGYGKEFNKLKKE